MSEVYMMVSITNKRVKQKFRDFYRGQGLSVMYETLGFGTASSEILDYFGIEATEKVICFSFVTDQMWSVVRKELVRKMYIDVPGTGIAFTIPLGSVGGKNVLQFLLDGQEFEKEEESILKETEYELLVIIANQGSIDSVMDAARNAKASGGTVIHAKGTGRERAEQFLGVSLAEEREMIFIVTPKIQKDRIMKAVMEEAGLKSKEKAFVFSLPVTSVAGLRKLEEEN